MTGQELKELIHSAVYRIIRQLEPYDIETFMHKTIKETIPSGPTPSGWPDFWWESLSVEIQAAAMARKKYLSDISAQDLKKKQDGTWFDLVDHILDARINPL